MVTSVEMSKDAANDTSNAGKVECYYAFKTYWYWVKC